MDDTATTILSDSPLRGTSPTDSSDKEYDYIGSLAIIGFVYSGVAFLTSIAFGIWTHRNRTTRVVKSSQPIFLLLICFGSFISSSSIIPMSFDDGNTKSDRGADVACVCIQWLAWPGAVLMYAAMFSKTWRANKVIHSSIQYQRVKVTAKDVIVPLVVLRTSVFIVLITWTLHSPIYYSNGKCQSDTRAYFFTIKGIFYVTILITAFQAWRARNISDEFRESHYIGLIMGVSIVALPLQTAADASQSSRKSYVVWATLWFLNCILILLITFVPKIVSLERWKRDHDDGEEASMQQTRTVRREKTEQPTRECPATSDVSSGLSKKGKQQSDA